MRISNKQRRHASSVVHRSFKGIVGDTENVIVRAEKNDFAAERAFEVDRTATSPTLKDQPQLLLNPYSLNQVY
jgi:hypothetical protein